MHKKSTILVEVPTFIHTCTRKLKNTYFGIDGDRWNMLSEISEEVPVSVVPWEHINN